jgi:hypothetical protein
MHTIVVLGSCCRRCEALLASAQQAAIQCGAPCQVEKLTDVAKMLHYNPIALPALVIDGRVVSTGGVPTPGEIVTMLISTTKG